MASCSQAELEERFDPSAAPPESGKQFTTRYRAAVDREGAREPVLLAKGLDPHAPGVVHVPGDHADRTPGSPGNRGAPEWRRQVLNKVRGDATVRPPGS